MSETCRVVTFDADQTLIDFRSAMRSALEASLAALKDAIPSASQLTVDDLIATRNEVAVRLGPTASMEAIRLAAFDMTIAAVGGDKSLAPEITRDYLDRRFREARLYTDVLPTLNKLRRRYVLGFATNGNSYPARSGLAGYFSFAVLAQDHGVRKPDRRFFEIVVNEAGCAPEQITHVGDSPTEDIAAAQALGLRTVWVNREGLEERDVQPWAEVKSLRELPALLTHVG